MFSRIRGFVSRNKKKFIVGGMLIAGSGIAIRYAQNRLREYQEKQVKEFLEKTRRVNHFESTEKTCDQAISGLLPGLCENIIKLLDTDAILAELRTNPDKKLALWEELKILSFARITALVYATSLLVTSLRVQLNVIGGYMYKDTISSEAKITKEIQTVYNLLLIQHLLNNGLTALVNVIRDNVCKIMKKYSLKEKLSLSDMEQVFWSIQTAIEKDINKNLVQFILPAELPGSHENEVLAKMLGDTLDMLESSEFTDICENSFNSGFSVVIDKIADFYFQKPAPKDKNQLNGKITEIIDNPEPSSSTKATTENLILNESNGLVNINNIGLPLAKLIPILNGLTTQHPNNNGADQKSQKNLAVSLITLQLVNQNIKTMGANVYEVHCK